MEIYEWLNKSIGDFDLFIILSDKEVKDNGLEKSVSFSIDGEKKYFYFVNVKEGIITPMPMLSLAFGSQYNDSPPYTTNTVKSSIDLQTLTLKYYHDLSTSNFI